MPSLDRPFGTERSDLGNPSAVASGAGAATSFTVSDVNVATEPLPELPCRQAVTEFLGSSTEACSSYQRNLVARFTLIHLLERFTPPSI